MVDHAQRSMLVLLEVDAGPLAAFGPVTIVGLERVEEDYVRLVIPWKEGQIFDQREVDEARLLLSETQLFQSISVKLAEAVDDEGRLPMTIELTEGDRRSIGGGVTFSTDEGHYAEIPVEARYQFLQLIRFASPEKLANVIGLPSGPLKDRCFND